jgi:epidermal growth factor receptor substrate 15
LNDSEIHYLISLSDALRDLLGDDDDTAADNATIHSNSIEIGNLTNQASSTQKSLKSTQEERKTLEETVAAQASQLSALQSQLATATAAYETEKKLVQTLQERMTAQNTEIQTTREALIRMESDVSGARLERAEIEGTVLRDKEEIRELQRKMKEATAAMETLKADAEKAKKDARQQKGLLAIAKKQLTTSEADKEKALKELEEVRLELEQIQKDIEETEAKAHINNQEAEHTRSEIIAARLMSPPPAEIAAKVQIPDTPDLSSPATVTSPAASIISNKSTNPFDKLNKAASISSSPKSGSPFQPLAALPVASPEPAAPAALAASHPDDPFGFGDSQEATVPPPRTNGAEKSLFDTEFGDLSVTPVQADTKKEDDSDNDSVSTAEDKFPDLDAPPKTMPGGLDTPKTMPGALSASPSLQPKQNDEFAPIKELEPEESDSSDDEDAYHTAADSAKDVFSETSVKASTDTTTNITNGNASNGTAQPTFSAFDDAFADPASPPVSPAPVVVAAPVAAQDPAFVPMPVSVAQTPTLERSASISSSSHSTSLPWATPATPETKTAPTIETVLNNNSAAPLSAPAPAPVAIPVGVSAFDETMGLVPASKAPSTDVQFKSNFDDAFDFGSAFSSEAPITFPVASPAQPTAASASSFPPVSNGFTASFPTPSFPTPNTAQSFPNFPATAQPSGAFPTPNTAQSFPVTAQSSSASSTFPKIPLPSTGSTFSFDDAFGGNVATPKANQTTTNGTSAFDDVFNTAPTPTTATTIKAPVPGSPVTPGTARTTDTTATMSTTDSLRTSSPRPSSPPLSPNRTISSNRSSTPPPRASSPATTLGSMNRRKSMSSKAQPEEKKSKITVCLRTF